MASFPWLPASRRLHEAHLSWPDFRDFPCANGKPPIFHRKIIGHGPCSGAVSLLEDKQQRFGYNRNSWGWKFLGMPRSLQSFQWSWKIFIYLFIYLFFNLFIYPILHQIIIYIERERESYPILHQMSLGLPHYWPYIHSICFATGILSKPFAY